MSVAEPKVEAELGETRLVRYDDNTVLIEAPGQEPILISSLQAYMVATFILGTDTEREPYCCAGDT